MKVEIEIELDNDAFADEGLLDELTRILCTIPGKVQRQMDRMESLCDAPEVDDKLLDINGNTVGSLSLRK